MRDDADDRSGRVRLTLVLLKRLGLLALGATLVALLPVSVPASLLLSFDRVPPIADAALRSRLAAVEFFRPPRVPRA